MIGRVVQQLRHKAGANLTEDWTSKRLQHHLTLANAVTIAIIHG